GELAVLLRTGLRRDGQYVPPWMVKLPYVSDEDLSSIIAFLRSDDPWVADDPTPSRDGQPTWLRKFLTPVPFKAFDWPTGPIAPPNTADKVAYGRYLADNLLGCFTCHSGDFKKMDDHHPEKSLDYYGGGNEMPDINGRIVSTPNITPDEETGIGK